MKHIEKSNTSFLKAIIYRSPMKSVIRFPPRHLRSVACGTCAAGGERRAATTPESVVQTEFSRPQGPGLSPGELSFSLVRRGMTSKTRFFKDLFPHSLPSTISFRTPTACRPPVQARPPSPRRLRRCGRQNWGRRMGRNSEKLFEAWRNI